MSEVVKTDSFGPEKMKKVLQANGYKLGDTVMVRFYGEDSKSHKGIIASHNDGWGVQVEKQGLRYSSLSSVSPVSYEESTASSSNAPAVKGTEDMTTNVHVVESVVGEKSVTDTETGKPRLETVVLRAPVISVEGVSPPLNVQEWIHANNAAVTSAGVSVSTIRVLRSALTTVR